MSLNARYLPSGEMAAVLIGTSLEFAVSCLILGKNARRLRSRMPTAMIREMLSATAVPKRSLNGRLLTVPFSEDGEDVGGAIHSSVCRSVPSIAPMKRYPRLGKVST